MHRLHAPPPSRPGAPNFEREGRDWPHRGHSAFYRVGTTTWHTQMTGHGPAILLLHGTGAATHSFMDLIPMAAEDRTVIAVDLPGHGFTQTSPSVRPTQDRIAAMLSDLLAHLELDPKLIIGHSAGAAVMLEYARLRPSGGRVLVSLNGALTPFPGLAKVLFPATAQILSFGGMTAHLLAQSARNRQRVERLLDQTGGAPDQRYVDRYWSLLQCSAHVSGTLRMMANWNLSDMETHLSAVPDPIVFLAGSQDQAVDPGDADRLAGLAQAGRSVRLDRLGHLAHEQDAERVWKTITDAVKETGVLASD